MAAIERQRAKTAESLLARCCGRLLKALTHFQIPPHPTLPTPFLSNILHTEAVLLQSAVLQWRSPCRCWEQWVCLSFCLINKSYVCACATRSYACSCVCMFRLTVGVRPWAESWRVAASAEYTVLTSPSEPTGLSLGPEQRPGQTDS